MKKKKKKKKINANKFVIMIREFECACRLNGYSNLVSKSQFMIFKNIQNLWSVRKYEILVEL